VQYKVLVEGSGRKPTLKDAVTVNFRSTLSDGTEFDSTYRNGKPRTYSLEKIIPGLKEALPQMKEGAKWQVFIPSDLAFGDRGPLAEHGGVFIYEIELISVQPAK
jgi:FKBP-type peptidyl-prolyl cis-trans isomerase FklB